MLYLNHQEALTFKEETKMEKEKKEMRRELERMPFDKAFTFERNETLCHATGYEVCLGDPDNAADWWNEYVLPDGTIEYGR